MSAIIRPRASDTIAEINALAETLDNPDHRRMLEVSRDHYWGEVVWNIDGIMATLSPTEPISYRFHGGSFLGTDGMTVGSIAEARTLYEGARDSGTVVGPMRNMHYTFGREGMAHQSVLCIVVRGSMLANYSEPVEEDQQYVVTYNGATYFPFDSDYRYMLGEWVYSGNTPVSLEAIDAAGVEQLVS